MKDLYLKKGGYLKGFKNGRITFTTKIKKLFLDSCSNCTIILNAKCFTRVEMLRCNNVKLIFKKQCYNLLIDICYNINIEINKKYKDLIYLYLTSCIDILLKTKTEKLPLKWSMFSETYQNNYYKKEHIIERLF